MDILSLILALIALVVAIFVYEKVGGLADLRKQIDHIAASAEYRKSIHSIHEAADILRERAVRAIERLEEIGKGREERESPRVESPEKRVQAGAEAPPKAQDFQNRLESILADAQNRGESFVDIRSGDLHRSVGGYPGRSHRMPRCCSVMKRNMRAGDEILQQPPSGEGATLAIRFMLPR